jgi:type I restriction enzyme S subunit
MKTLQEIVHGVMPPPNWKLTKLRQVLNTKKTNKNQGLKEKNLLSLSYGRIVEKDIENAEGLVPESYETYQIVEPGDIVFRFTDLQNDKRSLRQAFSGYKGIITSAYDVVSVNHELHYDRYWFYFMYGLDLAKFYYSLGGGVRQSIKFDDIPNYWIAYPSKEEQVKIIEKLETELKQIDQLIHKVAGMRSLVVAEPNSFLAVLNEKRTSLIINTMSGKIFL